MTTTLKMERDRIVDAAGRAWAAVWDGNLVAGGLPDRANLAKAPRWVVWSGTPAEGLFDESPLIWSPAAWGKFEAGLRAVASMAGGKKVLVRPHARHVVSDLPSCLRVLERTSVDNARVLLDPAAMLSEEMRKDAEDHVTRILEGLVRHPGVEGVVVRDEVVERVLAKVWSEAITVALPTF